MIFLTKFFLVGKPYKLLCLFKSDELRSLSDFLFSKVYKTDKNKNYENTKEYKYIQIREYES